MSIRDRLKIYDSNFKDDTRRLSVSDDNSLIRIGFKKIDFEGQSIYRFRTSRSLVELLSFINSDLIGFSIDPFLKYNGIDKSLPIERLLFLDLETTSLTIGTGNYPFMIGLGYLMGETFTIDQFFMHNYEVEVAILKYILPYFHNADIVVSYNGKTFDMPLIKNRYRINRAQHFPVDITVVDLLYSCRRIFKNLYENCTLKTMEERVLGIIRKDDIPGWLIPEVFFSYQKFGETDRIPVVIEHNRMDIESMLILVAVLNRVYTSIEKRDYNSIHNRSLINFANYIYKIDIDSFIDMVGYIGNDVFKERSLFKKYSTALKRIGRIDKALALWESERSIFSLEELAKHYEHRERELEKSLAYCDSAVELLKRGVFSVREERMDIGTADFYMKRFIKRIARLNRKLI